MTTDYALKKHIRTYAAERGLSYTQARREYLLGLERTAREILTTGHLTTLVTIQQELRPDGVLPYPLRIDEHGIVDNQPFWRGNPFRLIGFVTDPDTIRIDLRLSEFLDEPDLAIGKHPIFSDEDDRFATFPGAVKSFDVATVPVVEPEAVRASFSCVGPDGPRFLNAGVGHLLGHLSGEQVEEMRAAGWGTCAPTVRLLRWLVATGNEEAAEFEEWVEEADEDPRIDAILDPEQAEAWFERR